MPAIANNRFFSFIDELFAGRRGTPFSADMKRDYVRRFRVTVKEKDIAAVSVCSCPGLPWAYSPYQTATGTEYDLLALLVKMTAEPEHEDDWQNWIVTCEYSTELPAGGGATGGGAAGGPVGTGGNLGQVGRPNQGSGALNNPEMEPPELDWDFEVVQRHRPKDLDGRPYVNSAGQPLTPAPSQEEVYAVLNYTRNELAFDRSVATKYAFAVNSKVFLGASPGRAQCLPPKARKVWRGSLGYWRVNYRIRFLSETSENRFQPEYLDQGLMEIDPVSGGLRNILLKGGVPASQPVLLDGAGRKAVSAREQSALNGDNPPVGDTEITPTFLSFRTYPSLDLNTLLQKGYGAA